MKANLKGKAVRSEKAVSRIRRHRRIRAKISGTAERPRLSVYRSNRGLSVQLIDDQKGATVAQANWKEAKGKTPNDRATEVGKLIAGRAAEKKVKAVVFDRGGFRYQGNIKALADAAREAGLSF